MKTVTKLLLLIITVLVSCLEMSAKLPFKDRDEFNNYVRGLNLDSLETTKTLEDYLDPVGVEPTDPVLLEGINLFNSGKIEEAIKYYKKILKNWKKHSKKQFDYADYQLFHITYFGMPDPKYNGYPTKMNRTDAFRIGYYKTYTGVPYTDGSSKRASLILEVLYPSITEIEIKFWKWLPFSTISEWDEEFLHVLLKATCQGLDLKQFPPSFSKSSFPEYNRYSKINLNDFADPYQYMSTLGDYMTSNRELPKLQILRRGIDLDLEGKHDEAYKYFIKLWKKNYFYHDYAEYQSWHILNFGQTDPYYNGKPSNIERNLKRASISQSTFYPKKRNGYYSAQAPFHCYMTIAASLNQCNGLDLIEEYLGKATICDMQFLDLLCLKAFNPNDNVSRFNYSFGLPKKDIGVSDLNRFAKGVKLEPLMLRMNHDEDNELGVGLTKDQLFLEAAKLLPPLPELKFDKGYKWDDGEKLYGKINNYLLRSAIKGNPMAMNTFIAYNLANINSYEHHSSKEWINEKRAKKLKDFVDCLAGFEPLNKHKIIISQFQNMVNEVYAYHKAIHDDYKAAKREAEYQKAEERRRRRAEMWGGIAQAVLQGVSDGLNIYSQVASQKPKAQTARTSRRSSAPSNSRRSSAPSNSRLNSQQVWAQYLNPQTFLYNYMNGLPTMPTSAQLGLTGSDAYAYDLQCKLQYESQLMDLQAQQQTAQLIADGNRKAEEEIQKFPSLYGRQPTQQEIQAIYAKYTQGYMNAYADYVSDNVTANNNLGLGKIDKTKSTSKTTTKSTSKTNSTTPSTSTKSNSKPKSSSSGTDNNASSNSYRYIQRKVNIHENLASNSAVVFHNCEIYQKGSEEFVKIGDQYYKIQHCNKQNYNRTIMHGGRPYWFNM